jgi:hypothetical protein
LSDHLALANAIEDAGIDLDEGLAFKLRPSAIVLGPSHARPRRVRTGTIGINGCPVAIGSPFGGVKASGDHAIGLIARLDRATPVDRVGRERGSVRGPHGSNPDVAERRSQP